MPKEWIDVVDTAVKIGLGALISGMAGHLTYKKRHEHEKGTEARKVKREMLLLAVEKSDEYFQYLSEYFQKLDGLIGSREKHPDMDEFWEHAKDWLYESEQKLIQARECAYIAKSRLQLLGFSEGIESLDKMRSLESELRKFYLALPESEELPTREYLVVWAEKYRDGKNTFQQQVSEEFKVQCL